jgi:hypothetical protein
VWVYSAANLSKLKREAACPERVCTGLVLRTFSRSGMSRHSKWAAAQALGCAAACALTHKRLCKRMSCKSSMPRKVERQARMVERRRREES